MSLDPCAYLVGHTLLLGGVGLDVNDVSDLVGHEVRRHGDDSLVYSDKNRATVRTEARSAQELDTQQMTSRGARRRWTYFGSPS